jgi:carbon monoxide dehydrogenase subunit G
LDGGGEKVILATGGVLIRCPTPEVFEFVADARNEPSWLPGAELVEKVTPGEVRLGTVFEGRYRGAGRVRLEIVTYEPPTAVTFRARARIVHFDDRIVLINEEGGTRLTAVMEAQPVGFMRIFERAMARTMKRQFAANWEALLLPLERRRDTNPSQPE